MKPVSNIKIIDNFIDEEYFLPIKTIMMNEDFPWYYSTSVVYDEENEVLNQDMYQFTHLFYNGTTGTYSQYYDMMNPLLDRLNAEGVIRIKSNLTTKRDNIIKYKFHTDVKKESKSKTAIYYVNTNNGYTLFKDGTKVESVENRMVIFDTNNVHTGTNCTDKSVRIVINLNYIER